MRKQPEVTAKTRENLVDAFCSLYAEKPIQKITIKEITDLSGYNRSTFYQYFMDVYDVLAYIEADLLTAMKKSLDMEKNTLLFPDLKLLTELFSSKETYLRAVLSDYGSVHFVEQLKQELPLDELKSAFPQFSHVTNYLVEFHLATSLSLLRVWIKSGKDIPSDELLNLIHTLYTEGVSAFGGSEIQKNHVEESISEV